MTYEEQDERRERADDERGREYLAEARADRLQDYAPAPDGPVSPVLLGCLDFLEATRRDLKAAS